MNAPRRAKGRWARALGVGLSVGFHLLILLALFSARTEGPKPEVQPITTVALVQMRPAVVAPTPPAETHVAETHPAPSHPAAAHAAAPKPTPQKPMVRPRRATRPDPEALPADEGEVARTAPGLSDAQLAGAASAESGPSGGPCDMVRWLQRALRKDPMVRSAVGSVRLAAGAAAVLVWNGDWVASSGQDGKGLAAVRESIMWEVGFAPEACRREAVHGLVLISLADTPGSARLVLGASDWRWGDLVRSHDHASSGAFSQR